MNKKKKQIIAIAAIVVMVLIGAMAVYSKNLIIGSKEFNTKEGQSKAANADGSTQPDNTKQDNNALQIDFEEVQFDKVIDGSTISVKLKDGSMGKVRLLGVIIPKNQAEILNLMKSKLEGHSVYLEKDISDKDSLGRKLRLVWIEKPEKMSEDEVKNKMLNGMLLEEGLVKTEPMIKDIKYMEYLTSIEQEAKDKKLGVWAQIDASVAGISNKNIEVNIDDKEPKKDSIIHITVSGQPNSSIAVTCHYKTKTQTYKGTINKDGKGVIPINIGSSIPGYKVLADIIVTQKDGNINKTQTFFTPK